MRAVQVIEEILENRTIAIYSVGKKGKFARLETASKGIFADLPRSLQMQKYADATEVLGKDEIWVNRTMDEDFPMYIAGVRKHSELVLVIMIYQVEYEQMTLYYENLLKIICGLIETALLRALDYQDAMRDKQYLEGLPVLKESYFLERLRLYQKMQKEKIVNYTLLQIDRKKIDLKTAGERLGELLRENDTLGLSMDGILYAILNQTTVAEAVYAIKRLEEAGFECKIISGAEEEQLWIPIV